MTLVLNEVEKRLEYRDGRTLVLAFHHEPDPPRYVTDRGEDLGRDFDEARRSAEQMAAARLQGKKPTRRTK